MMHGAGDTTVPGLPLEHISAGGDCSRQVPPPVECLSSLQTHRPHISSWALLLRHWLYLDGISDCLNHPGHMAVQCMTGLWACALLTAAAPMIDAWPPRFVANSCLRALQHRQEVLEPASLAHDKTHLLCTCRLGTHSQRSSCKQLTSVLCCSDEEDAQWGRQALLQSPQGNGAEASSHGSGQHSARSHPGHRSGPWAVRMLDKYGLDVSTLGGSPGGQDLPPGNLPERPPPERHARRCLIM